MLFPFRLFFYTNGKIFSFVQGFLYSKPLPPEELELFTKNLEGNYI